MNELHNRLMDLFWLGANAQSTGQYFEPDITEAKDRIKGLVLDLITEPEPIPRELYSNDKQFVEENSARLNGYVKELRAKVEAL